jgi:hypothetical protein
VQYEPVKYVFQVYLVKFSNSTNTLQLSEEEAVNEVGILTCF